MMRVVVAVLAAAVALGTALIVPETEGEVWAVLAAGSNGYGNYRHQADVCHAYQILHGHGVPDDHIIVMMYDDIAYNDENPNPGVIINRPGGPNVYQGVPKDYTGKDVTSENFLKVLRGDAEGLKGVGSGKVLKSGPNDRVFINMVDHGAAGLFVFPGKFLYVKDFISTIKAMSSSKQFKEMVIYMESCFSGSMFLTLQDDINVYALSAANSTQSSYACYFDETLNTYLGDVFSVKWMEDTDRQKNVTTETLQEQYEIVKKETIKSQVKQWGETSISAMKVSQFLGSKDAPAIDYGPFDPSTDPCLSSFVSSADVPLSILLRKKRASLDLIEQDFWDGQVTEMLKSRTFVKTRMTQIVSLVTGDETLTDSMMGDAHLDITDYECHRESTAAWHELCFDLPQNTYALRLVHVIVNLCEHGYSAQEFTKAARSVCTHQPVTGIQ